LQTAIHYSTGHYENAGIVREALLKKVYNSHLYQLSDDKQRNLSKDDAYRSINRAIDKLLSKNYLESRKTLEGDKEVILSTNKSLKWFKRKLQGN
jgi:hypothetical protein